MSDHYFSQKPTAEHDEKLITATFFNKTYIIKTDSGVFSKNRVDFGTSLLINNFPVPNEAKILDLGCGYGTIGLVVSSNLNSGKVVLADINERAVELARENIRLNNHLINENVELLIKQSYSFNNIEDKQFDYILINPPIRTGKSVIYEMFEDASSYLKEGGELWIVIQKKQGALSVIKKLNSIYSKVVEIKKDKGYFVIKSIK